MFGLFKGVIKNGSCHGTVGYRAWAELGHVFQGRFGAKLVDRDEYLMELVRYIHLNPYRVKNRHWKVPENSWPWSNAIAIVSSFLGTLV